VAVKDGLVAFGEIGLTGRLRVATQAERRLEECAKLGFAAVLAPKGTTARSSIAIVEAGTAAQALAAGLGEAAADADQAARFARASSSSA
jgi:DNA repair protein RadA/Sms